MFSIRAHKLKRGIRGLLPCHVYPYLPLLQLLKYLSPPERLHDCTSAQWSLEIIALPVTFIWHLFPAPHPPAPLNLASQSNCKLLQGWGHVYILECPGAVLWIREMSKESLMRMRMNQVFHFSLNTNSVGLVERQGRKSQIWQTSWLDFSMSHTSSPQKLWPRGMVLGS